MNAERTSRDFDPVTCPGDLPDHTPSPKTPRLMPCAWSGGPCNNQMGQAGEGWLPRLQGTLWTARQHPQVHPDDLPQNRKGVRGHVEVGQMDVIVEEVPDLGREQNVPGDLKTESPTCLAPAPPPLNRSGPPRPSSHLLVPDALAQHRTAVECDLRVGVALDHTQAGRGCRARKERGEEGGARSE